MELYRSDQMTTLDEQRKNSITSTMLHVATCQLIPLQAVAMMQMPATIVIKQVITLWEDC